MPEKQDKKTKVNPSDLPYNKEASKVYKRVEHEAIERCVFALIKGWAAEHDRLERKYFDRDPRITIREVQLTGEYPETMIAIRTYESTRDIERWRQHLLWQDPTFFDDEGKRLCSPERMASDILMHARGG